MDKLKVVFAGTPDFAIPSLQSLAADPEIEVSAVFTQPDRPVGRGNKITPPPVKVFAEEKGIKVFQPEKMAKSDLESLQPDFLAVVAYGMILPDDVLDLPRFGCVNLHASLLPKFRGASPIQSAILAGEKKTGVTFMQISKQLDAGDIYEKFEVQIGEKNAEGLSRELADLGGKFPEVLKKVAAGELSATPQNEAEATFCSKIKKEDGKVNWAEDSSETLLRKLRAFAPWPGVWTTYKDQVLKLLEFSRGQGTGSRGQNGEVFENEGKICVKTVEGAIELKTVQLEGKKAMEIGEFVRGNKDFVGARLG